MTDVLTWSDNHPRAKVLARTRLAIVAAAGKLFLDLGFERTTMERVASEASIGLMTLYRHFRNKAALFQVVMETECAMATVVPDLQEVWARPPHEALQTFGEAVIKVLVSPRQLALRRLVIAEGARFPELGQAWHDYGPARGKAEVADYVARRIQANDMAATNIEAFARMYIGLLDRLPLARLMSLTSAGPDEIATEAAEIVAMMLGPVST